MARTRAAIASSHPPPACSAPAGKRRALGGHALRTWAVLLLGLPFQGCGSHPARLETTTSRVVIGGDSNGDTVPHLEQEAVRTACSFGYADDEQWSRLNDAYPPFQVRWEWDESTICDADVPHEWTLTVEDANGLPLSGAELALTAAMPDGHPLPVEVVALPGDRPGSYVLEGMRFDRPGIWRFTLAIVYQGNSSQVRVSFQWE